MSNFSLLRALGWAYKSRLWNYEMAEIDARLTKTINAAEGSSHLPTSQIIIHGSGMDIAPLVSTDADLEITSGHKVRWKSGSTLQVDAGTTATVRSTLTIDHTTFGALGKIVATDNAIIELQAGAELDVDADAVIAVKGTSGHPGLIEVEQYGIVEWLSGASAIIRSGATLTVQGSQNVIGGGTVYVGVNGSGQGHVIIDGTGTASGSDMIVKAGGKVTVTGGSSLVEFLSGADLTMDGSSLLSLINGADLTVDTLGSAILQGDNYFGDITGSGQSTQYQPWLKSGDNAVTKLRVKTLPNTGGASFTASEADVWLVPSVSTLTVVTPVSESQTFAYVVLGRAGLGGKYTIAATQNQIDFEAGASKRATVPFVNINGVGHFLSGAASDGGDPASITIT